MQAVSASFVQIMEFMWILRMISNRANWYPNLLAEDMSLKSKRMIGQRDVIGLVWAYFSIAITGDLAMTMQAKYAKSNVSN